MTDASSKKRERSCAVCRALPSLPLANPPLTPLSRALIGQRRLRNVRARSLPLSFRTGSTGSSGAALGFGLHVSVPPLLMSPEPGKWFRSHPEVTLVLALLLLLNLALVSALAVVSGRRQTEIPVTFDTPLLLACPDGWVGYRGVCYFLSKDHRTWDQAQTLCSGLGGSLAVLMDWEMRFVFRLSGNDDHWLGLRRQDQGLQWLDGSSFNSSVPVLGNAECVFLADDGLRSGSCSNEMPYLCSRPQPHL